MNLGEVYIEVKHDSLYKALRYALENRNWGRSAGNAYGYSIETYTSEKIAYRDTEVQFVIDKGTWIIKVLNYVGERLSYGKYHDKSLIVNTPMNINTRRLIRRMKSSRVIV